jgi:hypothetical protein
MNFVPRPITKPPEEPAINIAEALADPNLLGAAIGNLTTWRTWLVTLKATFGLKLNRQERRTFESIAGSRQPPRRKVAQLWAIAGRGGGKSRIAAAIAVFIAVFLKHRLDPGEVGYVLVLAASRDQASVVFNYARSFFIKSAILRKLIRHITATEIFLTSGIVIAVHTNSYRVVRGKSLLAVVADEIAFWRSEESANPDLEVYRAIRPSLARTGGMLVAISTPYRRSGLLYARYKDHYAKDGDVLVVKGGTDQFNPTINKQVIFQEVKADPEGARSEWHAEFRSDVSALFDESVLDDAVDHSRPQELPPRQYRYYAFADASAGRHDAFTFCIGHLEGAKGEERFICDVLRGRSAPFDPRSTAWEFAHLARQYNCGRVIGDAFAGEWVSAAFRDCGISYDTSPLAKSSLYLEALPAFNRGAVSIPDQERLLRELRSLERRVHRSGKDMVDHPKHGSDDYANALCGALYLAMHELRRPKGRVGTIDFTDGGKVTWQDPDRDHSRVHVVHVTEQQDLAQRGVTR